LKPNYGAKKRRREEANRKYQEEKRNKRLNKSKVSPATEPGSDPVQTPPEI